MIFSRLERDFSPNGADYVYDKMDHFEKVKPYLYPKIEGDWKVILVDLKIDDCRRLITEMNIPDYVNLEVYLKPDVLGLLFAEYPKYRNEEKSKWDQYLEMIAVYPKNIEVKATSQIYRRCKGSMEAIRDALAELEIISAESDTITMRHVNSVLIADESVYARDILLTIFLKTNDLVPAKGHRLSKYKYGNPFEMYEKIIMEIGQDMAFYSMRKSIKNLYENKLLYMENKDTKDVEVLEVVDIMEILHAHLTFQMSKPKQLLACLHIIERRRTNVSGFADTILDFQSQHTDSL